jgi:hypothetical protein
VIFIVAVGTLALFEVAIGVQLLVGHKAARPCQAAQLRASVASDGGFSGEEDAMVELTNLSPRVCTLKGFPDIAAWTLAQRPFAFAVGHFYGPNEAVGPYDFPPPRALALHHGGAAYFDLDWVDEDAFPTGPAPELACVDNFYVWVLLPGHGRPVGPRLLVYGQLCGPKGDGLGGRVSPFMGCDPFNLPSPVTTLPRTAASWCIPP